MNALDIVTEARTRRAAAVARLRRVHDATGFSNHSIEERAGMVVKETLSQHTAAWIHTMQTLPGADKLERASEMFQAARDALVQQGLDAGLEREAAMRHAVIRILSSNVY